VYLFSLTIPCLEVLLEATPMIEMKVAGIAVDAAVKPQPNCVFLKKTAWIVMPPIYINSKIRQKQLLCPENISLPDL